MMAANPEGHWRMFDAELGLEVRQTTGGQAHRWEVRHVATGRIAQLDDAGFNRLRSDPGWLPEELR